MPARTQTNRNIQLQQLLPLSPVWAECAAATTTPPSPNCLYTIHAVYEDKNKWLPFSKSSYWLHTHGLNCCGIPELELIGEISKKNYDFYTNLLSHLVNYVISEGSLPPCKRKSALWMAGQSPAHNDNLGFLERRS